MEYQNTIAIYEVIAELTNQMLIAAKQGDWDKLTGLEPSRVQHVETLKFYKNVLPLSRNASERKVASVNRILADDREIRDLVSPEMAKLSSLINSTQNGKKLTRTYSQ